MQSKLSKAELLQGTTLVSLRFQTWGPQQVWGL